MRCYRYEMDLYLDSLTGHSKPELGPVIGAFYIKKRIERCVFDDIQREGTRNIIARGSLTNATGDAQHLYLEFAHDFSIFFLLSTLGPNKSEFAAYGKT